MVDQLHEPGPDLKRRLNPFALPAETDLRFNLLIVAAVMMALSLSHTVTVWLAEVLRADPDLDPWNYTLGVDNYSFPEALRLFLNGLWIDLPWMLIPLVLLLLVLGLALVIYWRHPARIQRRKSLEPLTAARDARLIDEVDWLADTAGIEPPRLTFNPNGKTLDGQAYGFPGRYVIRLGGRLRLLLRKHPAPFRAVVLHEMGHIVNRDVRRTYLAQSIWIAVLVLAALATAVLTIVLFAGLATGLIEEGVLGYEWGQFLTVKIPTYLLVLMQVIGTIWLLTSMRGDVLRVREFYADWQAALWGAGAALTEILRGNQTAARSGFWERIIRLHPDPADRLAALTDPSRLFQMGPGVPFVAGLLLPYVLEGALSVLLDWGMPLWRGLEIAMFAVFSPLIQANQAVTIALAWLTIALFLPLLVIVTMAIFLLPAYFVAQAVGIQMQRQAILHLLEARRGCGVYLRLLIPALLLAAGIQLGLIITPLGLLAPLWNDRSWLIVVLAPVWIMAVTGLMWLWLSYAHYFGTRVVGHQAGVKPPHGSRRVYMVGLTLLLWALLAPVIIAQTILSAQTQGTGPPVIPYESVPIAAGVAVGLLVVISLVTWARLGLRRTLRRVQCATCGADAPAGLIAGAVCGTCGEPLAAWLYIDYAARDMALRVRRLGDR